MGLANGASLYLKIPPQLPECQGSWRPQSATHWMGSYVFRVQQWAQAAGLVSVLPASWIGRLEVSGRSLAGAVRAVLRDVTHCG